MPAASRASIAATSVLAALAGARRQQDRAAVVARRPVGEGEPVVLGQQVALVQHFDQTLPASITSPSPRLRSTLSTSAFCARLSGCDTSRTWTIEVGRDHLLQGGAERLDQFVRQIGDEPDGVGQDGAPPGRQIERPHRRIEGREQLVLGHHRRPGSAG